MNKCFNDMKYYLHKSSNRWRRTTHPQELLSHDVWNFYHPNDSILKREVIDHINEDSSDDRIENLRKMIHGEHSTMHNIGNQYSLGKFNIDETKQKMSKAKSGDKHWNFGRHLSDETKQKISKNMPDKTGDNNPMFGKHHTEETKQKISDSLMGRIVTVETKQKISKNMPDRTGNKHPNWKGGKK